MTAPGTMPTAMIRRSSARRSTRRAVQPAAIRAAAMTTASATVCQRTTRPSARWSSGSKSNAMTAIGTVPVSVSKAEVSAGRHLGCHAAGRLCRRPADHHRREPEGARGRHHQQGGRTGTAVLGDLPSRSRRPAAGGTGRASDARGLGRERWRHTQRPPDARPFGFGSSAPSTCAPPVARSSSSAAATHPPCSPCSSCHADRGPARRSPRTSGPRRTRPRPARSARPCGSSGMGCSRRALRRIRSSTSAPSRSASSPTAASRSTWSPSSSVSTIARADPKAPSTCIAGTWSSPSGTTASPPSASDWPIATRMPS